MNVVVTDHAVLRYLERVDGPHPMDEKGRIDVEKVREIILGDGRREAFAAGISRLKFAGMEFRLQQSSLHEKTRIVTTVIVDDHNLVKRPHLSNLRRKGSNRKGRGK